jgi:putative acetyltransferase
MPNSDSDMRITTKALWEPMTGSIEIRASVNGDLPAIEMLYPDVFPNEDLLPLVIALLQEVTKMLSLVGTVGETLVGHVIFTTCGCAGTSSKVALLGPLAVATAWQNQGIGSAIVRDGLQRLENAGVTHVYVLGDPAYYSRFGFVPETRVAPPYPLPAEWKGAWQSIGLGNAEALRHGELLVPQPWLQPALWAP